MRTKRKNKNKYKYVFITIWEKETHLLWVEYSDDLCDSSLVKCWDDITARGKELQLECLTNRDGTAS